MGLLGSLISCARTPEVKEGALYRVNDGEGWFRVAKILVVDDGGIHIRLYKNKWKERPQAVDISVLSLGSIHDADGFGMGHLPLARKSFGAWLPMFVQDGQVAKKNWMGMKCGRKGAETISDVGGSPEIVYSLQRGGLGRRAQ